MNTGKRFGQAQTMASQWFAHERQFQALCDRAVTSATSLIAKRYATAIARRAQHYGLATLITPQQLATLCTIAGVDYPGNQDNGVIP